MARSRNPTQNVRARPKNMSRKVKLVSIKGIFVSRIIRCSIVQKYNKKHLITVFGIAKLQTSIIQAWFYSCFDLFWLSVWNFHLFVRMRTKLPRVPLQCWKPRDLHSSHFHICIFLLSLISTFHPPLFLFLLSLISTFNSHYFFYFDPPFQIHYHLFSLFQPPSL